MAQPLPSRRPGHSVGAKGVEGHLVSRWFQLVETFIQIQTAHDNDYLPRLSVGVTTDYSWPARSDLPGPGYGSGQPNPHEESGK